MREKPLVAVLAVLALLTALLSACGPSATATPEPTPTPENTAVPTVDRAATREAANAKRTSAAATEAARPTATPEFATRDNPVPLGEPLYIGLKGGGQVELRVDDVLLGDDALWKIKQANQFNDTPAEGMEYLLAHVAATVPDPVDDAWLTWEPSYWSAVSGGRFVDSEPFGLVMPQPEFEGEILPGGTIAGWVAFEVPVADDMALVFLRKSDRGGWWFAVK